MLKPLHEEHLTTLKALLSAANLPTKDIDLNHQHFVGIYENNQLTGAAALEYYGRDALLRSVVVADSKRKTGLGKHLVKSIENLAVEKGVSRVFLLTETAKDFFFHLGYEIVNRDEAPEMMKSSSEFSYVCPASAICMMLDLGKAPSGK